MRHSIIYLSFLFMFFLPQPALALEEEQSLIIEVTGDPHLKRLELERAQPLIKVVMVYDTLLKGIAIQGKKRHIQGVLDLPFVSSAHEVYHYSLPSPSLAEAYLYPDKSVQQDGNIPGQINPTPWTGKGVKVGVIDTGLDYEHPDLSGNFKGGYDLVDLDDDPKETGPEAGLPTLHGTHVAGIIGANGQLKGVAPDVDLYAYRALGPGGVGSSIQVIAALEAAVKDGMDIINLSLGNSINGPDFPTSLAVDRAHELGSIVVIANGNDGPEPWTVGSPATSAKAISVGALAPSRLEYVLADQALNKEIVLSPLIPGPRLPRPGSYEVIPLDRLGKASRLLGRIPFISTWEDELEGEHLEGLDLQGPPALFIAAELVDRLESFPMEEFDFPIIPLSREDSEWLAEQVQGQRYFIEIRERLTDPAVADFSSRGPVTVDWTIKPDLLAPGREIISTVPGGYLALQGTSMAAPYVAAAYALILEARPDWTQGQIINALKTTAKTIKDRTGQFLAPSQQGLGLIQIEAAIQAETIIHDPLLALGKTSAADQGLKKRIVVENMTEESQSYAFDIPKGGKGYRWQLPKAFTLAPLEKRSLTLELSLKQEWLEEGLHEGFLSLRQGDESYDLPYLFIHEESDHPILMGFGLGPAPYDAEHYHYQFYLSEAVEHLQVNLFHADTLHFEGTLLSQSNLGAGLERGKINLQHMPPAGIYQAQISLKTLDGRQIFLERELVSGREG